MGYDARFLGPALTIGVPTVDSSLNSDLVVVLGSSVIDYTHFSLSMSRARRLARWVAWNIDGADFQFADEISRAGMIFRPDPRVPLNAQTLENVYASNSLDRGHLARRSDLLWGPLAEATQANRDSFYFTNIAPQRDTFNHSGAAGVWGELENALLNSTQAEQQRVSVMAGPVLSDEDLAYRGTQLPRSYWKALIYDTDGSLSVRAFLLTQNLDGLERITLEGFAVHQVALAELSERTSLVFDPMLFAAQAELVLITEQPRLLRNVSDVEW